MPDYKRLIPSFQASSVLNALLDVFIKSFDLFEKDVEEALRFLNIDEASADYLDFIGALVGIERPMRDITTGYLKTDDFQNVPDYSKYFVSGANTTDSYRKVDDVYFRMLIRAQIIRNSCYTFSRDEIESFCRYIFSNERFTYIDFTTTFDGKSCVCTVSTDNSLSQTAKAFLQRYIVDSLGRKVYDFPYPAYMQRLQVNFK
jgi:hypothetical protein